MPFRIDVIHAPDDAFDRLIELGALDVDLTDQALAAIMPDGIDAAEVARVLGVDDVRIGLARGRDADSVWVVKPRPVRLGRLQILPASDPPQAGGLRMLDSAAFGTGLHPTTALGLRAMVAEIAAAMPTGVLDVGTGSGVLALAALVAGVPQVAAVDIDREAVRATRGNARLNGLTSRLQLVQGGPEALTGAWPLVVANVLAAPLMVMAPVLARRVGSRGRLILSGIRTSLGADVDRAYIRAGMQKVAEDTRDGWVAQTFQASW